MKVWCLSPQSGGVKIPPHLQKTITHRANSYAAKCSWSRQFKLEIRYRNQFCYLDASEVGEKAFPIGRLRFFNIERWSLAFYTYSNESYQPCVFQNGDWFGTLEEAIDVCSMYLV